MDQFQVEDKETVLDGIVDFHDLVSAIFLSRVNPQFIEFRTFEKDGELIHYCNGLVER